MTAPWRFARRLAWSAALLTTSGAALHAQSVICRPSANSNEARLLSHYAVPLAFSTALSGTTPRAGEVVLALETSWLPDPPSNVRRSGECYQDKAENTSLSPVLPRPRIAIGLPAGFALEASLLPPVTVADATPLLGGVGLSYARAAGAQSTLRARAHATIGYIDGPVTCARSALQSDPNQPCFGDTPSEDRYAPNAYGAELLFDRTLTDRWSALAGAGVVHSRAQFDVNFVNAFGVQDDTRVRYDDTAVSITAGLARRLGERAALGVVAFAVPGRTTTVRVTGQWRLR
ncbi:MAG TPA: hypothetical protein PKE51_01125 [Gemmatimonadaceae bacterium]|nr:hypothetical protein [Gemmatimonadaceae bacterium]